MREEVRKWFIQAEYDFETAKENLQNKRFSFVVFLCHQSVEKALKSIVVKREKDPTLFIQSHSLIYLGKKARIPENFHTFLRNLTPEYVVTRYPSESTSAPYELYDENIAKDYLNKTEELLKWIRQHL